MKKNCLFLLFLITTFAFATAEDNVVRSNTGIVSFDDDNISIVSLLPEDYEEALNEWTKQPAGEPYHISTPQKPIFKKGQPIVPFTMLLLKSDIKLPIYLDFDLVLPNGKTSNKDTVRKLIVVSKNLKKNVYFLQEMAAGFKLSNGYNSGEYIIKIKFYNEDKEICKMEQSFILKD